MRKSMLARIGALAAVAAALALGTARPGNAETLRIGKSVAKSFTFALLDVGIESGIFKKHGLDLTVTAFAGGANLQQGFAAGAIDIGLGAGPDMAFIVKGSPVMAVSALLGTPNLVLIVRPDAGITSADDLRGKLISVSSPYSMTGWLVRELAHRKGWPDGSIRLVANNPSAGWAAMRTKEIDGMVDNIAAGLEGQEKGLGKILVKFQDLLEHFHTNVIFASKDLVQKKPETVRAFLAAWIETVAYAKSHKAETVAIASKTIGIDPKLGAEIYDLEKPLYSDDGRFDPAALAVLKRSFVELKLLDTEPDMSGLYTEAYLPAR
jgi:NitT/TauT family transport system substrate-binding protein